MRMQLHELHPAMVHAPLVLLPTAAALDVAAALGGDRRLSRIGQKFWAAVAASGLLAGLAGMAASQEVKVADRTAKDAMFVHGIGNFTLVVAAIGVSVWRARHRASLGTGFIGLAATGAAIYTAFLGGELVYAYGVGSRAMARTAPQGVAEGVPLLSREAPGRFLRDALKGAWWLACRAAQAISGNQAIESAALGIERGRVAAVPPSVELH